MASSPRVWTLAPNLAQAAAAGPYTLQSGFLPAFQRPLGPALRMERSGLDCLVFWPAQCSGFHLEAASDVAAQNWTDVGAGFHFGSDRVLPVTSTQSYRFFRLRKTCSGGCPQNCPL